MGADPPGQAPQATGSLDVRRWVEQVCGGTVVSWQRAPTGGSRETYLVEVARAGSSTALVLRAESGGSFAGTPINVAKEATVYRALEATAVPVPRVLGVAPGGPALPIGGGPRRLGAPHEPGARHGRPGPPRRRRAPRCHGWVHRRRRRLAQPRRRRARTPWVRPPRNGHRACNDGSRALGEAGR